jgi:hypothetical protein
MHTRKEGIRKRTDKTTIVALHKDYPSFNIEPKGTVGEDN